jgi:hypothetical protein
MLEDVVNIAITRDTVTVARESFNVILILTSETTITPRTKSYGKSELATLASELTGGTAALAYMMATAIFSQNPSCTSIKIGKKASGDASITAALTAIMAFDNAWYGLVFASRVKADQLLVAAWTEANKKICALASAEADIVDVVAGSDTTSLAAQLKTAGYARSFAFYLSSAATAGPDAAILGKILPFDPGSYTAKFKTLAGITVDNLTTTQETNALAKNCMIYTEMGGVNITQAGCVAEGEWIDTIIFIDWLESRIRESVYELLVSQKKVPFDDGGISAVVGQIQTPLDQGIANGGMTQLERDRDGNTIGGYVITAPLARNVSASDKNNRTLNNVEFIAYLAGAIHAVAITGVVTV